jgi:Tol biopolymer transport system component
MKRKLSLSILAFLAAVTAAASSGAAQLPQESPNASILFVRATIDPQTGQTLQSALFRISPAGGTVVPLTPQVEGFRYGQGDWSPSGSSIVYTHYTPSSNQQLFVVNRQGGSERRITTGRYEHFQPVWGPQGTVAFLSDRDTSEGNQARDESCVSVVTANGVAQHDVFCPPFRSDLRGTLSTSRPQWSADGKSIYVEVGAYERGLDPTFSDSRIYRVNASTGAVVKLFEGRFGVDIGGAAIAPDGKHAIYAGSGINEPLILVDLMTGARRTLRAIGADVRYSRDGCQIAFVKRFSVINSQIFGTVFVMNADGSNVHRAISHPDPNATYAIGDWSPSNAHLLVNKALNDQVNDQVLQVVNLVTRTATTLTRGSASEGAWYRP